MQLRVREELGKHESQPKEFEMSKRVLHPGLAAAGLATLLFVSAAMAQPQATWVQGSDLSTPQAPARFLVYSQSGMRVRLFCFADRAVTYQLTTSTTARLDSLPLGVATAASLSSLNGITGDPNQLDDASLGPNESASRFHRHTFSVPVNFQYLHSHGVAHISSPVETGAGPLPANVTLIIDGVDRTGEVTWVTQNPSAPKERMLDGAEIQQWLAVEGAHWIEIGSTQPGMVRYLVVLSPLSTDVHDSPSSGNVQPRDYSVKPNPSSGAVVIDYAAPGGGATTHEFFDASGRLVRTMFRPDQGPGNHRLAWDGRDEQGSLLPSGIYLHRVTGRGQADSHKVVLVH